MNEYPRMLYKFPGIEQIHGGNFATLIVNDEAEQESAAQDGWKETTTEAKDPTAQPVSAPQGSDYDREALKAQAIGLGLEFPKNVPTERLAEMVAEAKAKE